MTGNDSDGEVLIATKGSGSDDGSRLEAFDALVLSANRSLARLAFLMVGDRGTAEDVVAEAFARAWVPWQQERVDELGPYVRRTVVNLCLQGQRRRLLERHILERFRARPETEAFDSSDTVAHLVDLRRALRSLSREHRAVVVLRFFADLSEQETAEALQVPIGTVKSRTSRALKALRPMIGGGDDG